MKLQSTIKADSRSLKLFMAACLAWLAPSAASARSKEVFDYDAQQIWKTAVRLIRVEQQAKIQDRDLEAGYLLFDYKSLQGQTFPASVEIVATPDRKTQLIVDIPALPSYVERTWINDLKTKLKKELGNPIKVRKEKSTTTTKDQPQDRAQANDESKATKSQKSHKNEKKSAADKIGLHFRYSELGCAPVALIVQKYGGTSVGSLDRIRAVADRVAKTRAEGHDVVCIVSAIAGETNRLIKMGHELSNNPAARELDALTSTGEQVSAALLSIVLNEMGVAARSLLGHQMRMLTDGVHTRARIRKIDDGKLKQTLDAGEVAVVAGFQGIDDEGNITTLGRGGSDTTAVAIAAATKADACEIYTDVDGVYTTDPNICKSARKIARISYEEMLELASLGAKVLQIRSVELAKKYGVAVHVRSSFSDVPGTWVVGEQDLEAVVVAGVALDKNETKLTLQRVPDQPGIVANVFEAMAKANVSVDMIIQNVSEQGSTDLTFTVTKADVPQAQQIATEAGKSIGAAGVTVDESVVKVSVVGLGMRSHAGVAAKMFRLLANEGINIIAISTSEIKVSCLIDSKYGELAVRALHNGFELDKMGSTPPPSAS